MMKQLDCLANVMSEQGYKRLARLMAELKMKYGEVKT